MSTSSKPAEASSSSSSSSSSSGFSRKGLEDLMKRRFFVGPAFSIYQGVAGLYDYGPTGCAVKANLINLWRQHFVLNEDMLEVDCTSLTPEVVLATSGHVARFADFMVRDAVTNAPFRADHILEAHLDKLIEKEAKKDVVAELELVRRKCGDYNQEQLQEALRKYNVKAPETNNDISDPFPFNLMFKTQIGPSSQAVGYLRPETAQGIFVNFKRLLDYNGSRLPFAAAQIGNAFRNEIAPRSGLLRVREFTMAEIEHFVKEDDKSHPKFVDVAGMTANLLSAKSQGSTGEVVQMTFGDAVGSRTINNETLGYYMARTQLFLLAAGVKPARLRFRQHQSNEMAHYASDCWDAEIHTSYGWVECVGHADRSCFDLSQHSKASGVSLQVWEDFKDGPRMVDTVVPTINKGLLGKNFRNHAQKIIQHFESIADEDAMAMQAALEKDGSAKLTINGEDFQITKDMIAFVKTQKKINGRNFTPHVIEPSFGLGRIIYSILEHNYYVREGDEQRGVLSLPPILAPVKVSVLPLRTDAEYRPFAPRISKLLKEHGLSNKVDENASIGRRYARTDEIGIPFGITVDPDTLKDDTVTLRERDTTKQIRIPISEVAPTLQRLCDATITWETVCEKYPAFVTKLED
eukprot:TRINITY_DN1990_c0_g1_i1.p1 TRINITY_DN1990_c0_g1~~TRINITY_DN1990_c0_g1_i1.p1  ORF type:complete len:665 (+),score=201.97 TRINITY_DN1990_c0_g1_i1:95-1996(+)